MIPFNLHQEANKRSRLTFEVWRRFYFLSVIGQTVLASVEANVDI